jgi:hypothetical protein
MRGMLLTHAKDSQPMAGGFTPSTSAAAWLLRRAVAHRGRIDHCAHRHRAASTKPQLLRPIGHRRRYVRRGTLFLSLLAGLVALQAYASATGLPQLEFRVKFHIRLQKGNRLRLAMTQDRRMPLAVPAVWLSPRMAILRAVFRARRRRTALAVRERGGSLRDSVHVCLRCQREHLPGPVAAVGPLMENYRYLATDLATVPADWPAD